MLCLGRQNRLILLADKNRAIFAWHTTDFCRAILSADKIGRFCRSSDIPFSRHKTVGQKKAEFWGGIVCTKGWSRLRWFVAITEAKQEWLPDVSQWIYAESCYAWGRHHWIGCIQPTHSHWRFISAVLMFAAILYVSADCDDMPTKFAGRCLGLHASQITCRDF